MAEKGRPSASSGNAYHDIRVAHCLIDLLEDPSCVSVAVETADATDDLVVRWSDESTRYEQVKERAPGSSWTAARLVRQGILEQFIRQYEADPNGEFVLFTASDALKFREVVERAQNASKNHSTNELGRDSALDEWRERLKGLRNFVDQILKLIAKNHEPNPLTWRDLLAILARVTVLDASGTADQLRRRGVQRLRPFVDDPTRAFQTLERMARDAAISRGVLTRRDVQTALERDGSGLRLTALSPMIDAQAYAEKVRQESNAVDVAKLQHLEPSFRSSSQALHDLNTVKGRLVLVGSHGSGKSRVAAQLAVKSIEKGRPCLHVRLARWATTLRNLLIAELSVAAGQPASADDFSTQFRHAGVLVLDGLDEVSFKERQNAEREIIEFADTYPHLDILVTCRPGSGQSLSQHWNTIQLQPLTRDQIESTLGLHGHEQILRESIVKLASNPLMLGLLVQQLANDEHPSSEATLLDAYVMQMVQRQSSRAPLIDLVCGQRLAEEVAFEWLSLGRIILNQEQMRSLSASVARTLRSQALIQLDAYEVENWLEEAGFSIKIAANFVPIHRTVLDHLAARSMGKRNPVECADCHELREAVARFLGAQTLVTSEMRSFLNAVGTDLELLARGRALSSNEIVWPLPPEEFALEYLAQLRRLGQGPLVDIGVVDRPIQIEVDTAISWITERDSTSNDDVVNIVETAVRPHIVDSSGSNPSPVLSFSAIGHHGAAIDIKVPQYAAFARVRYELEALVERRALQNEGPDIVYERLCSFAKRFLEVVDIGGRTQLFDIDELNMRKLTASTLQAKFSAAAASITEADEARLEVSDKCIVFVSGQRRCIVVECSYIPGNNIGWRPSVHGGELARLIKQAKEYGISELPLHPLMLLPESTRDPVLALPSDQHLLRGAALQLYVRRHELGGIRAFRYLVENNLHGLRLLLRQYSTMPWRVEMAISENVDPEAFGARMESIRVLRSEFDEVLLVSEITRDGAVWSSRANMLAYRGVRQAAYDLVEQDLRDLLSGSNPLGAMVL